MQCLNLVLLLVAVSSASACKYFCRTPGTFQYECCDDGNPYFNEDEAEDTSTEEKPIVQADNCLYWCLKPNTSEYVCCDDGNFLIDDDQTEVAAETEVNEVTQAPSRCYYYCAYDGEVYCCGDSSRPIPESHDMHDGRCPEEDEQVCKSTGVFLNSQKVQAKTSGAIRLVSGPGKEQDSCASDGYCSKEEKCCPSQCARKHICMKAIDEE